MNTTSTRAPDITRPYRSIEQTKGIVVDMTFNEFKHHWKKLSREGKLQYLTKLFGEESIARLDGDEKIKISQLSYKRHKGQTN